MNEEEKLYENIYKKTQSCGRTQFVKLLQQKEIKLRQLQQENEQLKEELDISNTNYDILYDYFSQISKLLKADTCEEILNVIKQRIEVIDEAIKKVKTVKEYKFDLIGRYELLGILRKYKGDSK